MPLWTPSPDRIAGTRLTSFAAKASALSGQDLSTYAALHQWSITDRLSFWSLVWDECGVVGNKGGTALLAGDTMLGDRFFPEAKLNYAENLLSRTGDGAALVFRGEDKASARWSWDELHAMVSRLQQALLAEGVQAGDRVAGMMPNLPETVATMLAVTSIGAVWSSCSPDFGVQGALDRFEQIEPKIFVGVAAYWFKGKPVDCSGKLAEIADGLKAQRTIVIGYAGDGEAAAENVTHGVSFEKFIAPYATQPVAFTRLPFNHPLFILFSSGTTGKPKCIVHGAGGTLLQHLKEQQLHCDLRPGDRFFYFTTCGWMMWNWLVSGLASGATLCLFDGSPFHPEGKVLWDFAEAENFAVFGTSAKYLDALRKEGVEPTTTHDLSALRLICSTGSPLSPEGFGFVYDGIKHDVHLASISGGTDIVSCFVLGVPWLPVFAGEVQGPGLGMAVDVRDEAGQPISEGKGELVCTRAFPSMPIGFWNDADGSRYHAAYFERFDDIWCHGDFAEWTTHGGVVIHGRSDATLNPGGVRIGTAEIYNQVEQFDEVLEALCIGQDWDDDVRVVLFVRMAEGIALDDDLIGRIRQKIRTGASPRHMPAKVIAVADIPRTKSGKITELAVRDVVHGRPVHNVEALANPEALELFRDLPALQN